MERSVRPNGGGAKFHDRIDGLVVVCAPDSASEASDDDAVSVHDDHFIPI